MILSSKWMVLPVVLALTSAASEAWAARVAQPQGAIDARLGDRRASRQRTAGLSRQNRWSEQPGSSRGQSERRRAGHAKRAAVFCRPRHAVRSRARHESRAGQLCGIALRAAGNHPVARGTSHPSAHLSAQSIRRPCATSSNRARADDTPVELSHPQHLAGRCHARQGRKAMSRRSRLRRSCQGVDIEVAQLS